MFISYIFCYFFKYIWIYFSKNAEILQWMFTDLSQSEKTPH